MYILKFCTVRSGKETQLSVPINQSCPCASLQLTTFTNCLAHSCCQVIVPISNQALFWTADWTQISCHANAITTVVNEAKGQSVVKAWGLTNELSLDGNCNPLSKCMPILVKAAQLIAQLDPSSRPIIITSIFDAGFAAAKTVKQGFTTAGEALHCRECLSAIMSNFITSSSITSGCMDPGYQQL